MEIEEKYIVPAQTRNRAFAFEGIGFDNLKI
jgi:hypothetical protein